MNTSASLLIPVLHGFNGRGDNFPRKEAIVLSEPLAAKCTFVTPNPPQKKEKKKRQVCNLDKIKPLRARVVTVLMLPTMEQDERDK